MVRERTRRRPDRLALFQNGTQDGVSDGKKL